MMKKKVFSFVLMLSIFSFCLSGCGSNGNSGPVVTNGVRKDRIFQSGQVNKTVSTNAADITVHGWDLGETNATYLCIHFSVTNKTDKTGVLSYMGRMDIYVDGAQATQYGGGFYADYRDNTPALGKVKPGATADYYVSVTCPQGNHQIEIDCYNVDVGEDGGYWNPKDIADSISFEVK